jgi:hypothetical protein
MKKVTFLVLAIFIGHIGAAEARPELCVFAGGIPVPCMPASPDTPGLGSLEGVITDSATGKRISGHCVLVESVTEVTPYALLGDSLYPDLSPLVQSNLHPGWIERRVLKTDTFGHFRVEGLTPGYYRLAFRNRIANLSSYVLECGSEQTDPYLDTWYGGSAADSAERVLVTVGTSTEIEAQLQSRTGIRGVVVNDTGAGLENVCVFAETNHGVSGNAVSDANGRYKIFPEFDALAIVRFDSCDSEKPIAGLPIYWQQATTRQAALKIDFRQGSWVEDVNAIVES